MKLRAANLINRLNPGAPKGLIESAGDWIEHRRRSLAQMRQPRPRAFSKLIFAAEENLHQMRGATKRSKFDEFQNVRWTITEEARLYYLEDCRILGDEAAVISPDNKLFCEFTFPPGDKWEEHSCFRRRRIPNMSYLPGWYATIVYPESKFFFHWMIESLPRVALLDDYIHLLDGIFVPGPLKKFHKESLGILGIGEEKLIPVDVNTHYQPQRLFVPRAFSMYNPPKWMMGWFKDRYLKEKNCPDGSTGWSRSRRRKLYVTRRDAPARRVLNEDEVVKLLESLNFQAVTLTEFSFLEQATLFNQADVIVSAHGAGLSNVVFCTKESTIVEIFPPRWMAPCFMVLASITECLYKHVVGCEIEGSQDPQRDDFIVPLDRLEECLSDVL